MGERISIILADDHPVFRQGLRQILEAEPGFEILGEAGDGQQALELIRRLRPMVAVLDFAMPSPDGLSVARALREEKLPVEIIFLTMYRDESIFRSALEVDVKGYVLKDSAAAEIVDGIKAVSRGENYASPALTSYLIKSVRDADSSSPMLRHQSGRLHLSPAERRVLELIAQYKTSKDIAAELSISRRTVETHRTNIRQKLGLHGSHALMRFALEHKSVER